MKNSFLQKTFLITAASAVLAIAGCSVGYQGPGVAVAPAPGAVVYADAAPPPPLADPVVGVAPGPGFLWVGGGWAWGGGRWRWNRGYWGHPPHPGAVWVAHGYEYRNGRHIYHRGEWR